MLEELCHNRALLPALQSEGSQVDASSLKIEDEVELFVVEDFKADKRYATNLRLIARGEDKRELGQVCPQSPEIKANLEVR